MSEKPNRLRVHPLTLRPQFHYIARLLSNGQEAADEIVRAKQEWKIIVDYIDGLEDYKGSRSEEEIERLRGIFSNTENNYDLVLDQLTFEAKAEVRNYLMRDEHQSSGNGEVDELFDLTLRRVQNGEGVIKPLEESPARS